MRLPEMIKGSFGAIDSSYQTLLGQRHHVFVWSSCLTSTGAGASLMTRVKTRSDWLCCCLDDVNRDDGLAVEHEETLHHYPWGDIGAIEGEGREIAPQK